MSRLRAEVMAAGFLGFSEGSQRDSDVGIGIPNRKTVG